MSAKSTKKAPKRAAPNRARPRPMKIMLAPDEDERIRAAAEKSYLPVTNWARRELLIAADRVLRHADRRPGEASISSDAQAKIARILSGEDRD